MMIQCQTVKIFILNCLCINVEHVSMCLISMLETFDEDVITQNTHCCHETSTSTSKTAKKGHQYERQAKTNHSFFKHKLTFSGCPYDLKDGAVKQTTNMDPTKPDSTRTRAGRNVDQH